ncbi:MAG TPA: carboxypeptidase-like regulatory domain-containing protein, partial [Thermoanaerobaculia bacterium]|nr:carboxypeptidase-like regulatory domain-containing protein [Thermoanaerobaculia bacterium]
GKVVAAAEPLAAARIYLYRLGDGAVERALTDEAGKFLFAALPAGLYKVIVHKAGFVPAVVRLTRATGEARQFLDLELVAEREVESTSREDFWSVRAEIPPDVLRDIQVAEIADAARLAGSSGTELAAAEDGRVLAEMRAMTGIDRGVGGGEGQVTEGGVGIEGRVGSMRLGLDGDYWQLQPVAGDPGAASSLTGEASALSLELAGENAMRVRLTSRSNRLVDVRDSAAAPVDVDFEHYRLSVSHAIGERGRSDFSAQYTSESNFYRQGPIAPVGVPEESRSWRLEGVYTTELDERSSLQAGVRYRHRTSAHDPAGQALGLGDALEQEQVDLFGRAGTRVGAAVLVEYGLYTGLRDGSLSLSPRGGMVVQLGPEWQAEATAAHKVHDETPESYRHFTPAFLAPHLTADPCADNEQSCYRLQLTHQQAEDEAETFSIGASHREFDEVQRLDFSEDLADRHEGLYLVPGDQLPEIEVALSRRLTPRILARWQSNVASGGGGVFYATDRASYENNVRYLVTSVDTRFDGTSTGLFLAFHHLEQDLQALGPAARDDGRQIEVEKLELMLTQDLDILAGLAADMAVQLNMQVSRGSWPLAGVEPDELRRRLMGGIALRF